MSKQPVGTEPITVPSVGVYTTADHPVHGVVKSYIVDGLRTMSGPINIEGRHAHLHLTQNQAEVLVYELAAQLGLEVTP